MDTHECPTDATRRAFLTRLAGAVGGAVLFAGITGCEETMIKTPTGPVNEDGLTVQGSQVLITLPLQTRMKAT